MPLCSSALTAISGDARVAAITTLCRRNQRCHSAATRLAAAASFALSGELAAQPGPRQAKIMAHGVDGSTNDHGCLLRRHASEIVHFDNVGERLILARESFQRTLHFQ